MNPKSWGGVVPVVSLGLVLQHQLEEVGDVGADLERLTHFSFFCFFFLGGGGGGGGCRVYRVFGGGL